MATVIEHPTHFTSLPREYYLSDEILEREHERIFRKQWLYVAHGSELPSTGDYIVREVLGESVVLVRDENLGVNGFINICRHRGSRICDEAKGHVTRFVCPYHQWNYRLDGSLRNAPSIPDGEYVDYAGLGLHRVHVDVWQGLIFISFAPEAPASIAARLDESNTRMERLEPERLKVAHTITYEVEANWKIALENFQECYHCVGAHRELLSVIDNSDLYGDSADMPAEVAGGNIGLRPGFKSFTLGGEYVSAKLLGEFGRGVEPKEGFGAGFMVLPAFSGATFSPDHGTTLQMRPVSPERTDFIFQWFVHEDAVEGRDYEVDQVIALWDITNRQDGELCKRVQQGMSSRYHEPGPNSLAREAGLHGVLNMYLAYMGDD